MPKTPQNPSGSNDDHQDGTVVGTIWMDSTDSDENSENQTGTDDHQNGTETGTKQTENAIAHSDITCPDSTVSGTDQTVETEPTLDKDAYNLELDQAVASIEEPNKDTDDVNIPALPGLVPENNESVHARMENVINTVGTMLTVDTAEINNHEDTQGHAGIPGGTVDADTQAGTHEPGNCTVDVNDNCQPHPDSDSNVDNNNSDDNPSDTDSVHTSGCSTCPSSISSSESCATDCTQCEKDAEKTKHKCKKKGKKRRQSDESYPSGYESSSLPRSPNADRKKLHKTLRSKPNYKVDVSTADEGSTSDSGTENAVG